MMNTIKYMVLIYIVLTAFSCNQSKKQNTDISQQYKIDVLNKILNDSLFALKIKISNETPISNKYLLFDTPILIIEDENGNFIEENSFLKYLSNILKEEDTLFLKRQILSNKNQNITSLSDYGFNIVDSKNFGKISFDSLQPNNKIVFIDLPLFNKNRNRLYFRIAVQNSGYEYLFTKENERWKLESELIRWVE